MEGLPITPALWAVRVLAILLVLVSLAAIGYLLYTAHARSRQEPHAMSDLPANRCPIAIRYGTTLHTRCRLPAGHVEKSGTEHFPLHEGKGLSSFPQQRMQWYPKDRREYETARPDEFSWEEPT